MAEPTMQPDPVEQPEHRGRRLRAESYVACRGGHDPALSPEAVRILKKHGAIAWRAYITGFHAGAITLTTTAYLSQD